MAWISQDEKKALAPAIKSVLAKYGMKGSIGIRHHSTLVVNLQAGAIDFGRDYLQVNEHCIDRNYTGVARDFLTELHAAMLGPGWFDKSDITTDYFHVKHYISINVGQWNKPYILKADA